MGRSQKLGYRESLVCLLRMAGLAKFLNYAPPLILMALIFVSSSIPMDGESKHFKFVVQLAPTIQNLLHIPVFGLLVYLWMNSLSRHGFSRIQTLIITIIITAGYGIFDEFHQLFVPGRYASFSDFLFKILGCTIGITIFFSLNGAASKDSETLANLSRY
jgi:VanZ family protein